MVPTKRKPAAANDNADVRKMFASLKPTKTDDWQGWKDRIWESIHRNLEPGAGFSLASMACLEQYMMRSKAEKRCIECGDPGTVEQRSRLIAVVDIYWMCGDCHSWWAHKSCTKRSHKRCFEAPALPLAAPPPEAPRLPGVGG